MQLASIAPPRSPGPAEALDAVIAPPVVRRTEVSDPSVQVARAADLIARGRTLEARPLLRQTLESRPDHHDARAALVALLAEAGERDTALQLLLDGARIEPARFAASAAQLQFALGDAEGALATLNRVPAAARTAALNALAAGIAQQAGKHELSVALYEAALAADPAPATWWLGLGFAFDAVGRRSDAATALKKALAGDTLPGPARAAARERLAALGG